MYNLVLGGGGPKFVNNWSGTDGPALTTIYGHTVNFLIAAILYLAEPRLENAPPAKS